MKGTTPPPPPKLVDKACITSLICWKGRHHKQKDLSFNVIDEEIIFSLYNFGDR